MVILQLVIACSGTGVGQASYAEGWVPEEDVDADGVVAPEDCDDLDASVFPGAEEVCANGLDDDCRDGVDCSDPACASEDFCQVAETCDDGGDEDGDGLVDCADPDCVAEEDCAVCEASPMEVFIGDSFSSSVSFGGYQVDDYPCLEEASAGQEIIWAFVPTQTCVATVRLDPEDGDWGMPGLDASLAVMAGSCHPELCLAGAEEAGVGAVETLTFPVEAFVTYFVAVERHDGDGSDFEMSVSCQ